MKGSGRGNGQLVAEVDRKKEAFDLMIAVGPSKGNGKAKVDLGRAQKRLRRRHRGLFRDFLLDEFHVFLRLRIKLVDLEFRRMLLLVLRRRVEKTGSCSRLKLDDFSHIVPRNRAGWSERPISKP